MDITLKLNKLAKKELSGYFPVNPIKYARLNKRRLGVVKQNKPGVLLSAKPISGYMKDDFTCGDGSVDLRFLAPGTVIATYTAAVGYTWGHRASVDKNTFVLQSMLLLNQAARELSKKLGMHPLDCGMVKLQFRKNKSTIFNESDDVAGYYVNIDLVKV